MSKYKKDFKITGPGLCELAEFSPHEIPGMLELFRVDLEYIRENNPKSARIKCKVIYERVK